MDTTHDDTHAHKHAETVRDTPQQKAGSRAAAGRSAADHTSIRDEAIVARLAGSIHTMGRAAECLTRSPNCL